MRILFWSTTFLPTLGGAEVLGFELARALHQRGHDVGVLANVPIEAGLAPTESVDGVEIRRFAITAALLTGDPGRILRMKQAVSRFKAEFAPDVVHVLLFGLELVVHRLTAASEPVPEVATLQQPVIPLYQRPKSHVGATLRAARWLVAPSEAALVSYREAIPGIEAKSSVILNSLPLPSVEPTPPPADGGIVCVGRLEVQKGFDLAIAALARLRPSHPALRLVIAGDGPARPALERQAAMLGVAEAIGFVGWVPPGEVPRLLQSASVVVMPSRDHELFGLVALQAAQVGRPVVASALGGLREVVVDGATGLLIPPESEDALASAVAELLDDPEGAAEMGRSARRRASALFGWDRFVEAYERVYWRVASAEETSDSRVT